MKLLSMSDFVLEQRDINYSNDSFCEETSRYFNKCVNYAEFLKQPLNLGMFILCDLDGNVLEEPIPFDCTDKEYSEWCKAQERVLFEDMKIIRNSHNFFIIEPTKGTIFYRILKNNTTSTIEDLFKLRIDIMLTKSAQKQIGL